MLITLIIQISFLINIYLFAQYALKKDKRYIGWALRYLFINIVLIIAAAILNYTMPALFGESDGSFVFWVSCGILMIFTLLLKIQIFINISKRKKMRDSLEGKIKEEMAADGGDSGNAMDLTTPAELYIFMGTVPFFIISAAYFIAKIINDYIIE